MKLIRNSVILLLLFLTSSISNAQYITELPQDILENKFRRNEIGWKSTRSVENICRDGLNYLH